MIKLSIKHKLILSFLLIACLIVPVSFYAISTNNYMTRVFSRIVDDDFPRFHALLEMKAATMRVSAFISNLDNEIANTPVNENTPTKIGAAKDRLLAYLWEVDNWEKTYQEHSYSGKNTINVATLNKLLDQVTLVAIDVFNKKELNAPPAIIQERTKVLDQAQSSLQTFIENSVINESSMLEAEKKRTIAATHEVYWITIMLSLAIILLAILISLILASLIAKPIIYLKKFSMSVRQGNMNDRAKIVTHDEIGDLAENLNLMLDHLSNAKQQLIVAKEAVQVEKGFLNAMLDNLEDGIIACDETGKVSVINNALLKNLDIINAPTKSDNLLSHFTLYTPDKILIPTDDNPLFKALRGEKIHSLELLLKYNNGEYRNVCIDGQPIINNHGKKIGAVIVIHDVTELKKTDAMKSEFISIVSHELRTPLTSIRGSMGIMLSGSMGVFPEKVIKLLEIADRNCDRLLLLINDLLDTEKLNTGKMKFDLRIIEVNKIVKDAVVTNKLYCDRYHVKIKFIPAEKQLNIYVDEDRMLQVLANLISNAAKFAFPESLITVEVTEFSNTVRIAVKNQGTGIPEEFQGKIFQKFSQADSTDTRSKGGTGLGLSISKAIVEKQGGSISFTSVPDGETVFYVDMPLYSLSQTPTARIKSTKRRILICDDTTQAKYVQEVLSHAGFIVDIATSIEQAKRFLSQNQYHALLMNLTMPDGNAKSFVSTLRQSEKTKDLPIIVMSMKTESGEKFTSGSAVLIVDWLDKPVNAPKLLEAISRIKSPSEADNLPHILHVEDNPDVQHIVASLLENKAKITTATTIVETVHKLNIDTYDLVILDLALPDGSGSELLSIFSKFKLPIIVFSAFDLDENLGKYVEKALVKTKNSNDELLKIIMDLLKRHQKSSIDAL